jgi:colanic acid/amylovoran biosynthesis glycosyltransferase
MFTVAYLANQFPASVEPYVGEEIQELRLRGVEVISGSVRAVSASKSDSVPLGEKVLYLEPLRILPLVQALWLVVARWKRISGLLRRVILQGREAPKLRLKALLHTWLGAYYAVLLRERTVEHIHVHHGYFGSWIGMVAARLLGASFSLTLHGSDLLLHGAYLDAKLDTCRFCITISEYNRRYILEHFPRIDPKKISVLRLGVQTQSPAKSSEPVSRRTSNKFSLLAVGRLHAVKNHAFLVHACSRLRDCGLDFECVIAGEGPERPRLERLIKENHLQERVTLLGHLAPQEMDSLYRSADVVVLTSRSEGIPLVLMEAMARGGIVLAPRITGVPELVIPGRTGFLYQSGDLEDFVHRILFLQTLIRDKDQASENRLDWIRHAARVQVLNNFDREKNLTCFGETFLQRIALDDRSPTHEDLVLQQI